MGDGYGGNKLGQYARERAGIGIPAPSVYKVIGTTPFLGFGKYDRNVSDRWVYDLFYCSSPSPSNGLGRTAGCR